MEISPLVLAQMLLCSFFFGIGVGAFCDAWRIFRVFLGERFSKKEFSGLYSIKLPFVKKSLFPKQRKPHFFRSITVFAGDFFCVIFATLGLIVINYSYNDGRFRFFSVIGLVLGFLLYRVTLGRLIMLISEPIAFIIKYIFLSFFVILCIPFKKIMDFVIKSLHKICFLCIFTLEKKIKKYYNVREKKYFLKLSKNGFIPYDFFD